jgi:hypothetical protein
VCCFTDTWQPVANRIADALRLVRPVAPSVRSSLFAAIHHAVDQRGYERLNSYLAVARQVGQLTGMGATGLMLENMRPLHILAVISRDLPRAFMEARRGRPVALDPPPDAWTWRGKSRESRESREIGSGLRPDRCTVRR